MTHRVTGQISDGQHVGCQREDGGAQFVACQLYSYLCVPPEGSTWCLATCCCSTSSAALLLSWMTLADCFAGYVLWLLQNRRSGCYRLCAKVASGCVASECCDCTAVGIYDFRRLQVKRCGRLGQWASLAPACCWCVTYLTSSFQF